MALCYSDHEYEPVCPPPDDVPQSSPSIPIDEPSNSEKNEFSQDAPLTAQELQSEIEEKYFTQDKPKPEVDNYLPVVIIC